MFMMGNFIWGFPPPATQQTKTNLSLEGGGKPNPNITAWYPTVPSVQHKGKGKTSIELLKA